MTMTKPSGLISLHSHLACALHRIHFSEEYDFTYLGHHATEHKRSCDPVFLAEYLKEINNRRKMYGVGTLDGSERTFSEESLQLVNDWSTEECAGRLTHALCKVDPMQLGLKQRVMHQKYQPIALIVVQHHLMGAPWSTSLQRELHHWFGNKNTKLPSMDMIKRVLDAVEGLHRNGDDYI